MCVCERECVCVCEFVCVCVCRIYGRDLFNNGGDVDAGGTEGGRHHTSRTHAAVLASKGSEGVTAAAWEEILKGHWPIILAAGIWAWQAEGACVARRRYTVYLATRRLPRLRHTLVGDKTRPGKRFQAWSSEIAPAPPCVLWAEILKSQRPSTFTT